MKFPKLCGVRTSLYYLVCILSTPLFSQIASPTFETSHGSGPNITICEDTAVTFLVSNVPANSFFRFFRVPEGGSPQQLTSTNPSSAQITVDDHTLNDTFFAEIIYSQSGVTSTTQTTSITIDYFPSPTNLMLSTNLANSFYCANTAVEITAAGADFYEFFLDGISQGASSTIDMITPDLLRGETIVTVEGYNLFGCSSSVSITLIEVDLSPGMISGNQTIGLDALPQLLLNVAHAQLSSETFDTITTGVYQWQSSFDGEEWLDVLNASTKDFAPSLITTNTFFRRRASSSALGDLCTVYSNIVLVELDLSTEFSCDLDPITFNGAQSYSVDPCTGFATITVSSTDITGGEPFMVDNQPTYALEWTYVPFDSADTTRFNGYTIAQAFPGKYNLVISDANGCRLDKSDSLVINVEDVPTEVFDVQGAFTSDTGMPVKINYYDCVVDLQNVGQIGLVVNGGTPPFEVSWSYRANSIQGFQDLPQFANQYVLSNLAEGEYKVAIKSANSNCFPTDANYAHYNYEETFLLYAGLPKFTTDPIYPADLCQNGIGNVQIGVSDLPDDAAFFLEGRQLQIIDVNEGIYTLRIETSLSSADLEIRAQSGCILASVPLDIEVTQPQFRYSSLSSDISDIIPVREEVNFVNHTTDNYSEVIWHFGDGQSTERLLRSDIEAHSVFHSYLLPGNYQVRLEIFNGRGCYRTTTQTIAIGDGFHVVFPNAFTPNRDQINDVFRPLISGFAEVSFAVYDQVGTLLYLETKSDTNPPQGIVFDGWDGLNAPLPATNFIYTLQGTLLDQTTQIQRTGTFIALK